MYVLLAAYVAGALNACTVTLTYTDSYMFLLIATNKERRYFVTEMLWNCS